MKRGLGGADVTDAPEGRGNAVVRPRRPWTLIVASLLLAFLSAVLWTKWSETRARAERLQQEVKQVYGEAESLRTQAAMAQQRVALLEQQVRALTAERGKAVNAAGKGGQKPRTARPPPGR